MYLAFLGWKLESNKVLSLMITTPSYSNENVGASPIKPYIPIPLISSTLFSLLINILSSSNKS